MKNAVVENLARFIKKDDRLLLMLQSIKKNGGKTFLVNNSDCQHHHDLPSGDFIDGLI